MLKSFLIRALHIAKEGRTSFYNVKQTRLLTRPTGFFGREESARRGVEWTLDGTNRRHRYQININGKRGKHTVKSSQTLEPGLFSSNIPEVGEEGEDLSERLETWDGGQNSNNNSTSIYRPVRQKPGWYEEYLTRRKVEEGLANGTIVKGYLDISGDHRRLAFVIPADGSDDIYIINEGWHRASDLLATCRIRALRGDLVAVQIWDKNHDDKTERNGMNHETRTRMNRETQDEEDMVDMEEIETVKHKRRGKVVAVLKKLHPRTCAGHFTKYAVIKDRMGYAKFTTLDRTLPNLFIPFAELPPGFFDDTDIFTGKLFKAKIGDWEYGRRLPLGKLEQVIGDKGDIETEIEQLLISMGIDYSDFPEEAAKSFESEAKKAIPQKEIAYRRDFRDACIFTIDPPTAMDIDDAVSCEELGNGLYRVGVHIADVSHFLKENSPLDLEARKRTTSYYLLDKSIPMLPKVLSEELCSLNPDVERLAFSLEWIMTEDGKVKSEWFGRSIIKSCAKLTYDHAQLFIDNPDEEVDVQDLPPISEPFKTKDIALRIRNLHKIAVNLREKRFLSGALELDKMKLKFTFDEKTKCPVKCSIYEHKASNKLIEELKLLANMTVARVIKEAFPDKAVLRCHEPPDLKDIISLRNSFWKVGLYIDVSSAGSIQTSLEKYRRSNEYEEAGMQILLDFVSKPLMLAKYICAGTKNEKEYFHYALNVPLYTHFTSPIRRYPDILVHRLLAAVLGYSDTPALENSQEVLDHANKKRLASEKLEDALTDLYFTFYLKSVGPIREKVMVMSVYKYRWTRVLLVKYGLKSRISLKDLPLETHDRHPTLVWEGNQNRRTVKQQIRIFSILDCILEYVDSDVTGGWKVTLVRPED